jgi:putative adenylate-forming enzyme
MNIIDLSHVLAGRRRLRRNERMTRTQLEQHQARALARLRLHAYRYSRFYQQHHRGPFDRPLHELPITTKADVMREFDAVVTEPRIRLRDVRAHVDALRGDQRFLDRYWATSTSGSTGLRGLFLYDLREWGTVIASYARAMQWAEVPAGLLHRPRIGVVSSRVPWHQSARVGMTLETRIAPVLRLDATDPIESIVTRLNDFQPEVLVGYASMLRALTAEKQAGRLRIAPTAIMSASEVLTREARASMTAAFGVIPFNVYAATETAGIASECALHTGMHLYEDLVITEVVDESNRPVPPGEFGAKVLVTVLFSRTQPLIRYEMSDRVKLSDTVCSCGRVFRLIEAIEGRTEEVLTFSSDGGVAVAIQPNAFHAAIEPLAINGWRLVQEPHGLRLIVVGAPAAIDAREIESALDSLLRSYRVSVPLTIERVTQLSKTALGKAPLLVVTRAVTAVTEQDTVTPR